MHASARLLQMPRRTSTQPNPEAQGVAMRADAGNSPTCVAWQARQILRVALLPGVRLHSSTKMSSSGCSLANLSLTWPTSPYFCSPINQISYHDRVRQGEHNETTTHLHG
jgi:hypothetical protein